MGHQLAVAPLPKWRKVYVATGGFDYLATSDVNGCVIHAFTVGLNGSPEHQVSRLKVDECHRCPGRHVLGVRNARETDAGTVLPRGERQARAVVADRSVPTPDVRLSELLEREQEYRVSLGDVREQETDSCRRTLRITERVRSPVLVHDPVAVATVR